MRNVAITASAILSFCATPAANNEYRVPYSFHDVARLRHHLFVEQNLDSEVPPDQPNGAATQVAMQYRIFKIVKVEATTGSMKLMVWRRMTWTDPRLSWNVTEWGGVTDLRMHPALDSEGDRPDDRLWEPDLHHCAWRGGRIPHIPWAVW